MEQRKRERKTRDIYKRTVCLMPSLSSKDGTDGLGAVLEKLDGTLSSVVGWDG